MTIWRFLGVWLVIVAAILAAAWWLEWPLALGVLGGALFGTLGAWDDAFYCLGAWKDDYWWDDSDD